MIVLRIIRCDVAIEEGPLFGTIRPELKRLSHIAPKCLLQEEVKVPGLPTSNTFTVPNCFIRAGYALGMVSHIFTVEGPLARVLG